MQILFGVCVDFCSYTSTQLTKDLAFSTNTSSYRNTTGIGGLSRRLSIFAISHSESGPAEVEDVSKY